MSVPGLLALQVLTNLALVPSGTGVPAGWRLERARGVQAPVFRVTAAQTLVVESTGSAGWARYRLRAPLRPPTRRGALTWRWRTATPIAGAALRRRATDDSPARVYIVFGDGRMIVYSWGGTAEGRGETFLAGTTRAVVVLRRADEADGSWHVEQRDPFADFRRAFNRHPEPIVALGVGTDTDQLRRRAAAEVSEISWAGP